LVESEKSEPSLKSTVSKLTDSISVTQPSGIRWVAAYTVLIITGYGQYGLGFLLKGSEMFLGVALTLLALSFTVAIYGLLKRKLWGYKLTVALYTALICFEALRFIVIRVGADAPSVDIIIQIQLIGFAAGVLFYLKKEQVKVWFNLTELEAEKVLSSQVEMDEELKLVRDVRRKVLLICFLPILIVTSLWSSGKIAPIPEFNDLKITEGELIKVTGGSRNGRSAYLKLKKDNEHVFSVRVSRANYYRSFVGQRVKVWSAYTCALFGYWCTHNALQVKVEDKYAGYRNKTILDYKVVRGHMEKVRHGVGIYDYLSGGIAFFFLLLGALIFYVTKIKIKAIQDRLYNEEIG